MKVHERTIPLDHLSIREEDRAISISTYLQNIHIHLQSDQGSDGRMFTFPEFYEALQSLLKPQLAPTPSSLHKTPPSPDRAPNSGTPVVACESCGMAGPWRRLGQFDALCPECGGDQP